MKNIKIFIFFLVFLVIYPFLSVFCQDLAIASDDINLDSPDDVVFCAAVMPCDEQGNVLKEYLDSDCLSIYQERCLRYKLNDISEKECNCNKTLKKKNRKIKKLKAKIKFLQRR